MKEYVAYIDETGDPIFSDGASKTFFLGAIVFEKDLLQKISDIVDAIKKEYKLKELKSSKLSNFSRRLQICKSISLNQLKIVTIYVKKENLKGEWVKYKTTFFKYIQKLLNHEIHKLFGKVEVTIASYGSKKYQQSLVNYLEKELQGNLFEPEIEIAFAKQNKFIQACDFIIGTIRKVLDSDFTKDQADQLLEIFNPLWLVKKVIPEDSHYLQALPLDYLSVDFIACMNEAKLYLDSHFNEIRNPKILTLEYLYYSAFENPYEYIFTQEILNWLNGLDIFLSEEQFRNEVISVLRDDGVIIVASRKGLKIPQNIKEMQDYITFSANMAIPVLKRLKKAITFISLRTDVPDISKLIDNELGKILQHIDI